MRSSVLALALAACGTNEYVITPVIDSPNDADAAVLALLSSITVTVSHANGSEITSNTFDRGEDIVLGDIPFADDLVMQMDGFIAGQSDPIAIGRTCQFALDPDAPPPSPHLFLSRIGKSAALGITTAVRSNGIALNATDNSALILGGDNATSLEQFDPASGALTLTNLDLQARTQAAIARLSGKPVVMGGIVDGQGIATTIEVIDIASRRVDTLPDDGQAVNRTGMVATELTDGRILVTGGIDMSMPPNNKPSPIVATIRAKNDGTTIIERQADVIHPRAGHAAVRLGDDDGAPVLILGGVDDQALLVPEAELYKPLNDEVPAAFKPLMFRPRINASAVRLPDNSVVVIGGTDSSGAPVRDLERFSFVDGFQKITTDTLPLTAGVVDFSVTPLPDGRVLLTGGRIPPDDTPIKSMFFVSFNTATDTVTIDPAADELAVGRANHQAVLLCDGTVLITGGTTTPSVAERFNAFSIR